MAVFWSLFSDYLMVNEICNNMRKMRFWLFNVFKAVDILGD